MCAYAHIVHMVMVSPNKKNGNLPTVRWVKRAHVPELSFFFLSIAAGSWDYLLCSTLRPNGPSSFRFVVSIKAQSSHKSQREESGESQFQGSLWRATLSRKAQVPIWGLSTESTMSPGRLPVALKFCL